jgi:LEA14-like dessication related protein
MRPSLQAVLLAGLIGLAACTCSPQMPKVLPRVAQVTAVAPTGLQLRVQLDVHNPNSFPLIVHQVQGVVLLGNGAELGRGSARPPGSIPGHATTLVTTDLLVPWVNLAALAPFALSPAPVPYVFKGQATIGGEDINLSVPFELTGTLTRDQLLAAGLRGL